MKKVMCGLEESLQKTMAIVMSKKMLHSFWKNPNVANENYKSQFDAYIIIYEACASGITIPPDLMDG